MFFHDVTAWHSANSHANSTRPVVCFHLYNQCTESIDAPGLPSGGVLLVPRHRVGDGSGVAIDPVSVLHIVAVCSLVLGLGLRDVRSYTLDSRKYFSLSFCRGHCMVYAGSLSVLVVTLHIGTIIYLVPFYTNARRPKFKVMYEDKYM